MDSAKGGDVIRLSDLRRAKVRTLDGELLGRVHEVHCDDGHVTALTCGPGSVLEELTAKRHGRRIPWECVRKLGNGEIIVTPDPPQRKTSAKKSSGSRSRRRTQRATARPSKR